MNKSGKGLSRRSLLQGMVTGSVLSLTGRLEADINIESLKPPSGTPADKLAQDEQYWRTIATYYDATKGIVNLEHGYWGKMARPVQDYYIAATRMVNAQNSYYARKDYKKDQQESIRRVATALGVKEDEIVLTRNATEAIHNLIRQYQGLEPGDTVLFGDVDYPSFKVTMKWLEQAHNIKAIQLDLPKRASQQELLAHYKKAFDDNPRLKLILLTHVSNQHGMIFPVREITEEARHRGIDVICDSAQSWGLIDFKMSDINVDWAGFNLHKWIGSPLGVGALYMRRGTLKKIAPYPGETDPENTNASVRVHTATSNFAAMLSIPVALDFHQAIGGENKEARLNYLRNLWVSEAEQMPHLEVLGGKDEASRTGMASLRFKGSTSVEDATLLQQKLEKDYGIFTVIRKGLSSGACVRVTPQIFNSPDQIGQLVEALKKVRKSING